MNPSPALIEFLKGWESCRLKPYLDQAGKWTVGWGHLMQLGDDATKAITQAEADALFQTELMSLASLLCTLIKPVQQHFDACLSLTYNIGLGAFQTSTLRKMLNAGDFMGAAAQFERWNKVTINGVKQTSAGLTKRRKAERDIFISGNYGGRP